MPGTYTFKDPSQSGTVIAGGITTLDCSKSAYAGLADNYQTSLSNVYPNPVMGTATLTYSVGSVQSVKVIVYNSLGGVVEELFDAIQEENSYELKWNASHLNPGTYYVRFIIGDEQTVKPVIVK